MAVIDAIGVEMAADEAWMERILETPVSLRVNDLGDSGVDIKVVGRVRAGDQWAATGELRRRILIAFARDGIEIPFPHRVVISRTEGATSAVAAGDAVADPAEVDPAGADDPAE
jgi:small conductance mechanosensitive channel